MTISYITSPKFLLLNGKKDPKAEIERAYEHFFGVPNHKVGVAFDSRRRIFATTCGREEVEAMGLGYLTTKQVLR